MTSVLFKMSRFPVLSKKVCSFLSVEENKIEDKSFNKIKCLKSLFNSRNGISYR